MHNQRRRSRTDSNEHSREVSYHGVRPGAGKTRRMCSSGWTARAPVRTLIEGENGDAPVDGRFFEHYHPATGERLRGRSGVGCRCGRSRPSSPQGAPNMAVPHAARAALATCMRWPSRGRDIPQARGSGNNRQRETDRESRDIDIPWSFAILPSCGLGATSGLEFPGYTACGCGADHPLNFPLLMLAWKIAPALATGNTIVLKPADLRHSRRLPLPKFARRSGCRRGRSTSSRGMGVTGEALVKHPDVDKIASRFHRSGAGDPGARPRRVTNGFRWNWAAVSVQFPRC